MKERAIKPPQRAGDPIPALRVAESDGGPDGRRTIYDFGATYPLGTLRFGAVRPDERVGRLRIGRSLDGRNWTPVETVPADGAIRLDDAPARYVRLEGEAGEDAFFEAGRGFAAEPADDWTALFHRREGWTGADGIYSVPLNGLEAPGRAAANRTLLLFGDTFIGTVDPVSNARVSMAMINNSMALLHGDRPDPQRIAFRWNRSGPEPASSIVPSTPRALAHKDAYYWLQDGTSVGGKFHCFPLIVSPDPEGPEGFEFAVHGIVRVTAPIGEDGPMLELQEQADTPLYCRTAEGHTVYFGAAILPLTEEAGAPNPDGYVYVYGLRNDGATRLVAARVAAEELERIERWTFWNGSDWTDRIEDCAPIAPETSTELSVTPMVGGFLDGKFVVVYQQGGISGSRVAVRVGDSPVGPFGPGIPLHYCAEPEAGNGIYSYNAKAHPHLSAPGELLASYNVNTTSMDVHRADGGIYRPRFIRIRQIV
ncbi:DUF4185 domain-containing protein [Cohnella thermotolerans]|uniref:DUF4185 domain-containing protein n=1 Tax=Cohnella thermotolerans TaxID=329858 RepID=UPI00146FAB4B|nr:DUF4185 domain-containing protein [Cohnella thermotolerans]